ncbi:MAG: LTA synthase family protein [Ruminococcaceae bacterium]|nr:LTA synthase family protein [Oscillospiraceae bacterium]
MKRVSSAEKEKLSVRIKKSFKEGFSELYCYAKENAKYILPWFMAIVLLSAVSLFVTPWTTDVSSDFPRVLFNIIPRSVILLLFVLPSFIFDRRKTVFSIGATIWLTWLTFVSGFKWWGVLAVALIGAMIAVVFFFYEKDKVQNDRYKKFYTSMCKWLYSYAIVVLIMEIIQLLNTSLPFLNLHKAFVSFFNNPDYFANNILVFFVCSFFVMFVRRKKLTFSLCSAFWIIIAIISYLKSSNVYEPVLLLDVFNISEGLAAAGKYISVGTFILTVTGVILLIAVIVSLAKKEQKVPFKLTNLLLSFVVVIVSVTSFFGVRGLSYTNTQNKYVRATYHTNGFIFSFFNYVLNSTVTEPVGYSSETAGEIIEDVKNDYKPVTDSKEVQNVIVIQLESFCDPYLFKNAYPDLVFERDPMPYIRSLIAENTSGTIDVPIFGGQTVKSEFEFLTGLNMDFLPNGYNPYVTHLYENSVDSLARRFEELGYSTTAIHSYQGEFFDRDKVYDKLGFNTFIPYEMMPGVEKREGAIWANDQILITEIDKVLNSTEGNDFIFTVSVQLHGKYNPYDGEYPLVMENFEDEKLEARVEYYLSQLELFDKVIQDLVKYLEERNEPTYVLFYSDHLPSLFYGVEAMDDNQKFTSQFFTWNNLGIEKKSDMDMELFNLSTFLCDEISINGTLMNKFHKLYNDQTDYLEKYAILQHYLLFEECNHDKYTNEYKIGLNEIKIDSITPSGSGTDEYLIKGQNLTENCVIVINGKVYDLTYTDAENAILKGYSDGFSEMDIITLRVIGEKGGGTFYESAAYRFNQ